MQQAILDSPEFKEFQGKARGHVVQWFEAHRDDLEAIDETTVPNDLIATIGDDLLKRFKPVPLLDEYDVYQQLMGYWHETMHDDVSLIMSDGWLDAAKPRLAIEDKDRKLSETPDLTVGSGRSASKYKMDLVPPSLIVARYFTSERAKVDDLDVAAEDASRAVEEYIDEHGVEDGLLAEAMDDDKTSKKLVSDRLKLAKVEGSYPDEVKALHHAIKLYNAEAAAKKAAKDAQAALDLATLKKYGDLSEEDVKALVLDDKWRTTARGRVAGEVDALTLDLVARIQELGERYAQTVSALDALIDALQADVSNHLLDMGIEP